MRGYRRRTTAAYLFGVAAAFLLLVQLGGALFQLDARTWWGLHVGPDSTVRRVADDSPAERAGIRKGWHVESFAGADWSRVWEREVPPGKPVPIVLRTEAGERLTLSLAPAPLPRGEKIRLAIHGLLVLSFVVTSLLVFLSRSDAVATLFFWMGLLFARIMLPDVEIRSREAVFLNKTILDLASLTLPAVLLHFFLLFPRRLRFLAGNPRRAWLLYVPAIVSMPLAVAFDVEMILGTGEITGAALLFQQVTALLFVAMITAGIGSFLYGVRHVTSPPLRRSVRWVLPGTALGILPPLLFAAILNLFPEVEIPGDRYVFVTLILVPVSFGHAIIRYGLMDLELVVKRSAVYATLTALLVAVYYLVAEGVGRWVVEHTGVGRTVLSFAVVFAAALLFIPARDRVQELVDRKLYRRRYGFRSTIREFSRAFATFAERDDLVERLVERLPEILEIERAALFVRGTTDPALCLAGTRGLGAHELPLPCFHPSRALLAWWRETGGPVPLEGRAAENPRSRLPAEEAELLAAFDPSVLVFLPRRERDVEGLLLLGRKRSGDRVRSHDLELLATLGEQAGTALASARLHEEAVERRRLEEELAVARRIQASLLPDEIPQPEGVEIAALTRPSRHVGGDLYDFLPLGDGQLGLAVADVSGKGVPAALILSGLQATLRAEASADVAPEPVVRKVNDRLCADVQPGSFASLLFGRLDLKERTLRYVNAGHPAGLVVSRGGAVDRLEVGGILLGVDRDAEYASGSRVFSDGDLLLLYSDGVTDVLNADDEEFGPSRLEALLPRVAHLPVQAIVERIVTAVETFVGGSLPDDLTLLVAKFRPVERSSASPA
jgi:sigma-B regulation protein RsbU (phosphoserine phosphatase)